MGGSLSKSPNLTSNKNPANGVEETKLYSIPVGSNPEPHETPPYRRAGSPEVMIQGIPNQQYNTIQDIFHLKCTNFSGKNFLAYRKRDDLGSYESNASFLRYDEVKRLAVSIGSGLINMGLVKETELEGGEKLRFVGLYGANSVNYSLVQISCYLYGLTLVPLYEKADLEDLVRMLNQTQLQTLFISSHNSDKISLLMRQGKVPYLQNLVLLDETDSDSDKALMSLAGTNYYKMENLIKSGDSTIQTPRTVLPDDVACCSFTPGTTGTPKGALITHRNLIASIAGISCVLKPEFELVHLSYIPLAHGFELLMFIYVAFCGGVFALFGGELSKLHDDLAIFRPTIFICIPTVFYRLYDLVQEVVQAAKSGCMGSLFKKAIRTKLDLIESKFQFTHLLYDKLYFSKFKAMLGGRVQLFITGSTSISESAMKLMSVVFSAPFLQGYGFTEGLCAQFVASPTMPGFGHTGAPLPHNEFKLVDIPELGFTTSAQKLHSDNPKGEIYVRGANIIKGYLMSKHATQSPPSEVAIKQETPEVCCHRSSSSLDTLSLALFEPELHKVRLSQVSDSFEASIEQMASKQVLYIQPCQNEEGWYPTGDIGELCAKTHALKVLDRKSDVFKLKEGMVITPQDLEKIYLEIPGLRDFMITKSFDEERLIGIAALDLDSLKLAKEKLGLQVSNLIELTESLPYKAYLLAQIKSKWTSHKLKRWELVEELLLNDGTFEARGLLSPTMKIKRHKALAFYTPKLKKAIENGITSTKDT